MQDLNNTLFELAAEKEVNAHIETLTTAELLDAVRKSGKYTSGHMNSIEAKNEAEKRELLTKMVFEIREGAAYNFVNGI